MNSDASDTPRTLLAYFSHSYRPSEKEINLFFWELLSKHSLYFTVDSEENRDKPMDISYLEWMMRRCACFVAVIPRRDDSPPYNCSPYQVFENSLAIRAKKPRLIFVEEGLDETIFGVQPEEVCSFRRRREFLEEGKDDFMKFASRLAQRAHALATPDLGLRKPVTLLADTTQGSAYRSATVRSIRQIVRDQGYWFRTVNPTDFEQDSLFLRTIEGYSILISEVRQPYLAPDVLGLVHSRCVPTIRICHLEEHESVEEAQAAMHLPFNEHKWTDQDRSSWPLIFSKYQIDDDMEPVIFWKQPEEMHEKVRVRLRKITEKRVDLITEQEARGYFLRIGRLSGQMFISNAKAQNDFVDRLKHSLQRNAVDWFHYKDKDAIPIGSSDWLSEIIMEIRNSTIFVALVDSNYTASEWCISEFREAMNLFRNGGEIEIHAYVLEDGAQLPAELSMMQVAYIETLNDTSRIERIVENAVAFLETGKQVRLRPRARTQLVNLLAKLPSFASSNERRTLLQDAGLPARVLQKVRTEAQTSAKAAAEIVDDLAGWEQELKLRTKALGLLLSRTMGLVDSIEEQIFLAGMIRGYRLMPDIKLQLEARSPLRELGLAYFHERKELGTFESIQKGSLVDRKLDQHELDANLYALSVRSSAEQDDWHKMLRIIGKGLFHNNIFDDLLENYKRALDSLGIRNEQLGFCFATDAPGLRIPFEWAVIEGQRTPLCLRHPVRRFLDGCPEPRPTLRTLLEGEVAIPLRVLLVASNTGGIPEVENEVEELYSMLRDLFHRVGWPESNICRLNSQTATVDSIKWQIRHGHYHILHFAGHGGYDDEKPVLQVYQDASTQQIDQISATMLRSWIIDSDLCFVYLSSCRSASTEALELASAIRYFENVGQAIVEARVPEVIGFFWPIEDNQSRILATRFYEQFLKSFDAPLALYHARKSFEEENRIWAAPVLIQQLDTQKRS